MKRLLVVDDSRALRAFLEGQLSPHFDLEFAFDGQAGLERALRDSFDLVLSDVNMPRLNGFELHRALREVSPELPVVLMTDADVDTYLADALAGSVTDIIAKASFRSDADGTLRLLRAIESHRCFGMERMLGAHGEVRTFIAMSESDLPSILEQCKRILHRFPRRDTYLRILPELASNAFVHARVPGRGKVLETGPIYITVGADWQRVGFGVRDSGGTLTRKKTLDWFIQLLHQKHEIRHDGQGLLLVRWTMDQSFITIEPGIQTEILAFDLLQGHFGHRSLHLNELPRRDAGSVLAMPSRLGPAAGSPALPEGLSFAPRP